MKFTAAFMLHLGLGAFAYDERSIDFELIPTGIIVVNLGSQIRVRAHRNIGSNGKTTPAMPMIFDSSNPNENDPDLGSP